MTCEAAPGPSEPKLTEASMWANLEYWIRKVTPAAEKAGIRLGIHPYDPPVAELAGVPRLMRSHAGYRHLLEINPGDANAIEFCQGTFSENTQIGEPGPNPITVVLNWTAALKK